jgi:hypothetical protein
MMGCPVVGDHEMLNTYPAVLRDGRIEWTDDAPRNLPRDQPVRVYVTLLDQPPATGSGEQAAAVLRQIAAAGGLASIPDPDAWDRERREERPLPGREP